MATHSSVLAWRIPWTGEPGGVQSMGSQRVGHDWVTNTHTPQYNYPAWVCAKLLQSCLTLCDPMDCSLPGSSVHEVLQARILEWVAISYSRGSSWSRQQTHISCISCNGQRFLYHLATREAQTSPSGSPFGYSRFSLKEPRTSFYERTYHFELWFSICLLQWIMKGYKNWLRISHTMCDP